VLKALSRLVHAKGYPVQSFGSAEAFLAQYDPAIPGCAIFDVSMPGLDGIGLQAALTAGGTQMPIIFVTGKGDIPTSVRAMKAGAIDFLTKPVSDTDLFQAVTRAREQDTRIRQSDAEVSKVESRIAALTPREREVLDHVVAGRLNKQIAADLGTVEKTIKVHRSRMMEKMGVRMVADLVRMVEKANRPTASKGLPPVGPKANSTSPSGG
jgi:FixJ family two-component response regulator